MSHKVLTVLKGMDSDAFTAAANDLFSEPDKSGEVAQCRGF
jgi:hypothetical protein